MFKYGAFSGPYFPVFGLNTEIYGVNLRIQSDTGKYGPEKTLYLDNFHEVQCKCLSTNTLMSLLQSPVALIQVL